jgi:hypothetical protein
MGLCFGIWANGGGVKGNAVGSGSTGEGEPAARGETDSVTNRLLDPYQHIRILVSKFWAFVGSSEVGLHLLMRWNRFENKILVHHPQLNLFDITPTAAWHSTTFLGFFHRECQTLPKKRWFNIFSLLTLDPASCGNDLFRLREDYGWGMWFQYPCMGIWGDDKSYLQGLGDHQL